MPRAHGISQHSLRRWRDLIDSNEVEIDWRAHLHPSARPPISTSASSAAKQSVTGTHLTDAPIGDPPSDGRANRRRFSDEESSRSCASPSSLAPPPPRFAGATASSAACCSAGGSSSGSTRVRTKLAAVKVAGAQSETLVLNDLLEPPDGMTVIELDDGRRVFAPIGSDPDAVRRRVIERESAR